MGAYASAFGTALRPGAMVGLVVAGVVAVVGLLQLDERLMLIGLLAGPIIVVLNAVIVAVRHWHSSNTRPGASYVHAEEMIKLEQVSLEKANKRPRPSPEITQVVKKKIQTR